MINAAENQHSWKVCHNLAWQVQSVAHAINRCNAGISCPGVARLPNTRGTVLGAGGNGRTGGTGLGAAATAAAGAVLLRRRRCLRHSLQAAAQTLKMRSRKKMFVRRTLAMLYAYLVSFKKSIKVTLRANCGANMETKRGISVNLSPAGLPGFLIIRGHKTTFALYRLSTALSITHSTAEKLSPYEP